MTTNCFICGTYGETQIATRDSIYEQGEVVCDYHYWCEVEDTELEDWDDE